MDPDTNPASTLIKVLAKSTQGQGLGQGHAGTLSRDYDEEDDCVDDNDPPHVKSDKSDKKRILKVLGANYNEEDGEGIGDDDIDEEVMEF